MVPVGDHGADVRVATIRAMQAIENAMLHQQVQSAEDGRTSDTGVLSTQLLEQLVSSEGSVGLVDRFNEFPPRPCQPVPGLL